MDYRTTDETKYCKDCENSRWCRTWGELKCIKKMQRLYEDNPIVCDDFKKRKGDIEACKCDDCMSRAGELEDAETESKKTYTTGSIFVDRG